MKEQLTRLSYFMLLANSSTRSRSVTGDTIRTRFAAAEAGVHWNESPGFSPNRCRGNAVITGKPRRSERTRRDASRTANPSLRDIGNAGLACARCDIA
jgi:hypothetical protein